MRREGRGLILDQFANPDNPCPLRRHWPGNLARYPGPDHPLCQQHGHHRYHHGYRQVSQEQNPQIEIVGCSRPTVRRFPGIRKWPAEYVPSVVISKRIDRIIDVTQQDAEETARRLAREEGILPAFLPVVRWLPRYNCHCKWKTRSDCFDCLRSWGSLSFSRGISGLMDSGHLLSHQFDVRGWHDQRYSRCLADTDQG